MDWIWAEDNDQCAAARVSGRSVEGSAGGERESWRGVGGGSGWKDADGRGVEGMEWIGVGVEELFVEFAGLGEGECRDGC